jgi:hypothetical protein
LPGIDHVDSGFPEVLHVTGGQRRAVDSADSGNLCTEPVNGQSDAVAMSNDQRIAGGCRSIERDDELAEGGEYVIGCG